MEGTVEAMNATLCRLCRKVEIEIVGFRTKDPAEGSYKTIHQDGTFSVSSFLDESVVVKREQIGAA